MVFYRSLNAPLKQSFININFGYSALLFHFIFIYFIIFSSVQGSALLFQKDFNLE